MTMLGWLLLLPLIEIAGFVAIGPYLGVAGTLGIVLASTALGLMLLRFEGIAMVARLRRNPLPAAIDGAGRVLAALLLIVPGLISTALGLLLLIPPMRRLAVKALGIRVLGFAATRHGPVSGTVIDAEFHEVRRPEPPLPPQP